MKVDIIFCVPVQISYLGKILFPRYGAQFFQLIRLQGFRSYISPEQIDKKTYFLFDDTNS